MKEYVTLTLDEEIVKKIDEKRGLIPRSTYINNLLKKVVNDE